ncbi:MAG TPA: hypothetical protein VK515_07940 [Rhizomicrobium sp.]|nr:hypothetical protein [Rhizomicrobium sp.]
MSDHCKTKIEVEFRGLTLPLSSYAKQNGNGRPYLQFLEYTGHGALGVIAAEVVCA